MTMYGMLRLPMTTQEENQPTLNFSGADQCDVPSGRAAVPIGSMASRLPSDM